MGSAHAVVSSRDTPNGKSPGELAQVGTATSTSQQVSVEVHRTLADSARRKNNIVVSGLPEAHDAGDDVSTEDDMTFLKLCEEHFTIKPPLAKLGCRRLGKKSSTTGTRQPRKLLVHLTSEESAASILREARKLRKSDDPVVCQQVYINPDLCPAELQLAYERRKHRRERKAQRSTDGDHSTNITVVTSRVSEDTYDTHLNSSITCSTAQSSDKQPSTHITAFKQNCSTNPSEMKSAAATSGHNNPPFLTDTIS